MNLDQAIETLKRRNEWVVPNSDMDEAIETIVEKIEKIKNVID